MCVWCSVMLSARFLSQERYQVLDEGLFGAIDFSTVFIVGAADKKQA